MKTIQRVAWVGLVSVLWACGQSEARDGSMESTAESTAALTPAEANQTLFSDDFTRTSGLGASWRVAHGAYSTNGSAARGTAGNSYAFWTGTPPTELSVAATISKSSATYLGVVVRGASAAPDRDHYSAYVAPDGSVGLSRRANYVYTTLATGSPFPAGAHSLALTVSGMQPVVLKVFVDGAQVLQFTDNSASALGSGVAGIFDYQGAGAPVDAFSVSTRSTTPPPTGIDRATAQNVLAIAQQKLSRTAALLPSTQTPKSTRADNTWRTVANTDLIGWTQGFFPGALFYAFEANGIPSYRSQGETWTRALELQKTNRQTHDLGFKLFLSFGPAYRVTGDPYYRDVLLVAADSLASRFNATAGIIDTAEWNPNWKLPLVVDTMVNIELLLWAAANGGQPEWREMALTHALTTARELVRADGSTFHVVDFEPSTGAVRFKQTFQGYADSSTWTRGQAWAIYGFTLAYRYTRDPRMLQQARRVTDYYLSRLPADRIPNWDFDAPQQFKDSSAGAAVASALLELSSLESDAANRTRYRDEALKMLQSLASSAYLAPTTPHLNLLLHGVGHLPANDEVDVGLIYGDYYFIEALSRFLAPAPVPTELRLLSPNGGESLQAGQKQVIRWTTFGGIPSVNLQVSFDGGATFQNVQTSLPNNGAFTWTVPATATTQARIRLVDASTASRFDVSEGVFTIASGGGTPLFTDSFDRSGPLGSSWSGRGFSANGSAAVAGSSPAYMFWNGTANADDHVAATIATPLRPTFVGVTARARLGEPERDHYAAYVAPDGRIQVGRRTNYIYTYLGDGPAFPSGSHTLGLRASGSTPVVLSVTLDGVEVLRVSDGSANALTTRGAVGIFDYNGSGQPIDEVRVTRP